MNPIQPSQSPKMPYDHSGLPTPATARCGLDSYTLNVCRHKCQTLQSRCTTSELDLGDIVSPYARSRLTTQAEPRRAEDVNRESGTESANRRWLQRMVRRQPIHKSTNTISPPSDTRKTR